ncbi:PPE domain-containing protein [Saccharopolyspora sp. WRP15-2]|uniref:PPE domain-containing protein n=1 Tax=Saccharopolyspora oryzae TaxID=2997343 RepID=A0ABT4UVJ5_9PSEU|nr:PPE domain-containing protein [Saccharopolyspora oryzae]MDA3625751.1 PPE domain-containing protein [Saccharopolyspora oryzae]
MSDHRWQGYRHPELYAQINEGPGADGSTSSVRRWSELTRALGDIDAGLASVLTSAMAGWSGAAADSAHDGLRPLGNWAALAQEATSVMRERAEEQAEFIAKARRDMPPPVQVSAEEPSGAETLLTHLFGGQTDYEVQEAKQHAAEQRAFDVMRTYEASTQTNTTSLASFTPPPQVVVDVPPSGGSHVSAGQQNVTISWGPANVPAPRGSTSATQRTGQPITTRSGTTSTRGGEGRSAGAGRPTGNERSGGGGRGKREQRDETVDQKVTEKVGNRGGFFDLAESPSRPVIGGEPGQ